MIKCQFFVFFLTFDQISFCFAFTKHTRISDGLGLYQSYNISKYRSILKIGRLLIFIK